MEKIKKFGEIVLFLLLFLLLGGPTLTGLGFSQFGNPLIDISTILANKISDSAVVIEWDTIGGANVQVEYGKTTNYGELTEILNNDGTHHRIKINGLENSAIYHYRVRSIRGNEQIVSDDFTFNLSDFQSPIINSVSPAMLSSVDDIITIYGEDFNNGNNRYLKCNDLQNTGLNIINWTDTSVKFKFDKDAWQFSSNTENEYKCKVAVAMGGAPDYFSNEISVYINPSIESIDYNGSKTVAGVGDEITIKGHYFGNEIGFVLVNNVRAEVVKYYSGRDVWNTKEIKIKIPDTASGNLIVTDNDGYCSDPLRINILNVDAIVPKIIVRGQTLVTINGSGFGDTQGDAYLKYSSDEIYDSKITNLNLWSDSKIQFYAPSDIEGGHFEICLGYFGGCIETTDYYVQPNIKSIKPEMGVVDDEVIIKVDMHPNDIFPGYPRTSRKDEVMVNVYFNNIKVNNVENNWKGYIVQIPKSAKTGKIKVEFYTPTSPKLTATSNFDFAVKQPSAQDELSASQQYLQQTKIDKAWDYTHGNSDVIVAVIDDGIYAGHPDLDNHIWINEDEIEGNGLDDDNNGYIDDRWGWNFITNSQNMTPRGTHGTMVAGIVGAESNNGDGITGINWNVRLMSVIVGGSEGYSIKNISKGIKYAVDNGADIINVSLGGQVFNYSEVQTDDIRYAFDRNVLVVIAAGNGDTVGGIGRNLSVTKVSPVCNDGTQNMVLGVGAFDEKCDRRISWSNYGNCVDVYAPGENITSTSVPPYSGSDKFYDTMNGTSFSAPIVSGIAALIKSKYPTIKNTAIRDRIINTSVNGVVDAYKAISQQFSNSEKTVVNRIIQEEPIVPIIPDKKKSEIDNDSKDVIIKIHECPSLRGIRNANTGERFKLDGFTFSGDCKKGGDCMPVVPGGIPLILEWKYSPTVDGLNAYSVIFTGESESVFQIKNVYNTPTLRYNLNYDLAIIIKDKSGQVYPLCHIATITTLPEGADYQKYLLPTENKNLIVKSDGTLIKTANSLGVYLIHDNQKRPIKSAEIFLAKGYKWGDVVEVSQAEMNSYPFGTDLTIDENNEDKETTSEQKSTGTLSNGTLVRARGATDIYLIHNNQKRPIKSAEIFLAKGYKWGDIIDVNVDILNVYFVGPDVTIEDDTCQNYFGSYSYWSKILNDEGGYLCYCLTGSEWSSERNKCIVKKEFVGILPNGTLAKAKNTHGVYLIYNNKKRPIKSATIFLGRGYKWSNVIDVEQSILNAYPLGENVALSEIITTENETQMATINVPRLRVRSLPSLDGKIITLVLEGDSYDIISEQNGWYKINYEGSKTGWVMSRYTK